MVNALIHKIEITLNGPAARRVQKTISLSSYPMHLWTLKRQNIQTMDCFPENDNSLT
jgi:hypothetical protein